ncbi:MAG: lysine 2,3-aminomutase, partial [Chlamydiota bacterium]|nr:lysine 2,3-aminomutase [Chlamydiota bacterium]
KSIEILRIGTRCPVFLPQRITPELVGMLRKYHPFMLSVHINHPIELAPEVQTALERIADAGIPMGSQTVLLKGINDSAEVMTKLCHGLLRVRVRPYYIYQCDPVTGTEHFRTPADVGVKIIEKMRGHTSGYAVPSFVIDAPGGGGKIPISPNYVVSKIRGKTILRNYENKIFEYQDPFDDTERRLLRRRKLNSTASQLYLPNMGFDEPKQTRRFAKRIKAMVS